MTRLFLSAADAREVGFHVRTDTYPWRAVKRESQKIGDAGARISRYQVAPVLTAIESELLSALRALVGSLEALDRVSDDESEGRKALYAHTIARIAASKLIARIMEGAKTAEKKEPSQ